MAKAGVKAAEVIRTLAPAPKHVKVGVADFYYKEVNDKTPTWIKSFFGDDLKEDSLRTKTIQAALIKEIAVTDNEIRTFAITFGFGRNLLNLDKFEERFGINVALNLIAKDQMKTIDSNTLGSTSKSQRIQTSKLSPLTEFDLDDEYDLLKAVGGKANVNNIANLSGITNISGRTTLSLSKDIRHDQIDDMLKELYSQFTSTAYKAKFSGIDHICEIRDKSIISELNQKVIDKLNSDPQDLSGIEFFIPVITNENIAGYSFFRRRQKYTDPEIADLVTELKAGLAAGKVITLNDLVRGYVTSYDENGNTLESWTAYRCITADIRHNNAQYILNEGKWYKFEDSYVKTVLDYYDNAPLATINLPACGLKEAEGVYNKRIAKANADFIHMDVKLIRPENQSQFEVCDIFTKQKEFVHIKKSHDSTSLGHLFNQGIVSGEILNNSQSTRKQLLNTRPEIKPYISEDRFDASEYTVIYGIISKKANARPDIPFFSKIIFRNASKRLKEMGYTVKLQKIDWK